MSDNSYYLLGDNVEFHHEDSYLSHLGGLHPVNLQVPACRCLLVLVKNHGEIVSQADLMVAGWDDRSDRITANTLYQSILHLRRSLEVVGLAKDFIKTVNRKGLQISKRWNVSFHNPNTEPTLASNVKENKYFGRGINNDRAVITLSMLFMITASVILTLPEPKPAFNKYTLLNGVDMPLECAVYSNIEGNYALPLHMMNEITWICSKYPALYLTELSYTNKSSIIACNNLINSDGDVKCKSFYFPGHKK